MPNEARTQWDQLVEKCEESGLPVPVMSPLGLGEKIAVTILRDSDIYGFQTSGNTMAEVIDRAFLYVWGYQNALRNYNENQQNSS